MDTSTLLISTALKIVFVLVIILTFAPVIIWAERRQSAMIQDRIGPVRAGIQLPEASWRGLVPYVGPFKVAAMLSLLLFALLVTPFIFNAAAPVLGLESDMDCGPAIMPGLEVGAWIALFVHGAIAGLYVMSSYVVGQKGNITLFGLLHPLADALKFVFKEDFVPPKADKLLFSLAPIITVIPAIATFAVIPFAAPLYLDLAGTVITDATTLTGTVIPMQVASVNMGILFIFAVAGTGVVGAAIAGYASDNKYAMFGGLRAAGQMVSYEVTLGLTLVGCFMIYGSLLIEDMVAWQTVPRLDLGPLGHWSLWGVFVQPLAAILYFAAAIAETKRIPFDVPEAESELAAGYFTEYSGMKFGMFFMAEFIEVVVLAALANALFFGGYDVPFLTQSGFELNFLDLEVWRTTGEFTASAYVLPLPHWGVAAVQMLSFTLKLVVLIWFQLMIRWTLPRFRYDQIMAVCWKLILPLSLANILFTGLIVLLLG